ncbi:hypothetical protein [Streptomyces xanthochromogenes]
MSSLHSARARRQLSALLWEHETARALVDLRRAHATGALGPWADVVGQRRMRLRDAGWPMEQYAALLETHARVAAGRVAAAVLAVEKGPSGDACRTANGQVLDRLPHPFEAWVDPHQVSGEQDGILTWSQPVRMRRSTGLSIQSRCSRTGAVLSPVTMGPASLPLEIGDTLPSRTWAHLEQDGGVARWPYGSVFVWLLVDLESPVHGLAGDDVGGLEEEVGEMQTQLAQA